MQGYWYELVGNANLFMSRRCIKYLWLGSLGLVLVSVPRLVLVGGSVVSFLLAVVCGVPGSRRVDRRVLVRVRGVIGVVFLADQVDVIIVTFVIVVPRYGWGPARGGRMLCGGGDRRGQDSGGG